jgi:Eukaryotic translation initiation factor 3 subunit 7 (eIF-3)
MHDLYIKICYLDTSDDLVTIPSSNAKTQAVTIYHVTVDCHQISAKISAPLSIFVVELSIYTKQTDSRLPVLRVSKMPSILLADTIDSLGLDDEWGPETTASTALDGVPYAPYSKGDKLGRMADWTQEGKDGRDGRGGRQFNRNYRGISQMTLPISCRIPKSDIFLQISRFMVLVPRPFSPSR